MNGSYGVPTGTRPVNSYLGQPRGVYPQTYNPGYLG